MLISTAGCSPEIKEGSIRTLDSCGSSQAARQADMLLKDATTASCYSLARLAVEASRTGPRRYQFLLVSGLITVVKQELLWQEDVSCLFELDMKRLP